MDSTARAPLHLWIVGGVALLWNGYGCFDYLMTQTGNVAYYDAMRFTEEQRSYFEGFPAWMEGAWAVGVWGGLLGSLLLLARRRWAVAAFALSLLGLALGTAYQYLLSEPPPEMSTTAMIAMNLAIWAVAIGLLAYALRMRGRGVLR